MVISSNDLRPGVTVKVDNDIWSVVEFLHVKPGKGSAFVRTKLKNLRTGNSVERTFRAGERLDEAMIEKREMQYLYMAGDSYTLMDNQSFEQIEVSAAQIGSRVKYLKEEMILSVVYCDGQILGIDLPNFVELKITEAPPSEKGNTATGGTKPATLETGAVIQVPFFVNTGDMIRVDTRTDTYLDRV
ncbi:MAG: elongation factor P [Candidatus Caenarcaniphilales bacterium]|nr:elongation factor P [Candidatus Caenarcaniphilales bacterium]